MDLKKPTAPSSHDRTDKLPATLMETETSAQIQNTLWKLNYLPSEEKELHSHFKCGCLQRPHDHTLANSLTELSWLWSMNWIFEEVLVNQRNKILRTAVQQGQETKCTFRWKWTNELEKLQDWFICNKIMFGEMKCSCKSLICFLASVSVTPSNAIGSPVISECRHSSG